MVRKLEGHGKRLVEDLDCLQFSLCSGEAGRLPKEAETIQSLSGFGDC